MPPKEAAMSNRMHTGQTSGPAEGATTEVTKEAERGEPGPIGIRYSPFIAVTKFCYKYVPRELSEMLASSVFATGKIYNREWEIYYINSEYRGPITFVPERQLRALLVDINTSFPHAQLKNDQSLVQKGIVISFDEFPAELRPRWLGRSSSREEFLTLRQELLQMKLDHHPSFYPITDQGLATWKNKMDRAHEANTTKIATAKERKIKDAAARKQNYARQVSRAQRYLGLLPVKEVDMGLPAIGSLSVSPIDFNKPPPYRFDLDVIFIAIDVEAWEDAPHPVTEIGVATLDTRDLHGLAPGKFGENWFKHIRARHFRITETKHLINKKYLQGCPDKFEFGVSEYVVKANIAAELTSCLREPYSKAPASVEPSAANVPNVNEGPRKIILVGHDIGHDVAYCQKLGFSIFNCQHIIDTLDTSAMFRAYTRSPTPRSLGTAIAHLGIIGWNPHNAGNDAVYTTQALLGICVDAANTRNTEESDKHFQEEKMRREEELVEAARLRAYEELEGWILEPGDDGGIPARPKASDFLPKGMLE